MRCTDRQKTPQAKWGVHTPQDKWGVYTPQAAALLRCGRRPSLSFSQAKSSYAGSGAPLSAASSSGLGSVFSMLYIHSNACIYVCMHACMRVCIDTATQTIKRRHTCMYACSSTNIQTHAHLLCIFTPSIGADTPQVMLHPNCIFNSSVLLIHRKGNNKYPKLLHTSGVSIYSWDIYIRLNCIYTNEVYIY